MRFLDFSEAASSTAINWGGIYKKIASCIFLSGNAILWGTGVINLDSGWNKVLGSSFMIAVNACYFFGNNRPRWNNSGHILSIVGMVLVNFYEILAVHAGAVGGMAIYVVSRSLGIYSSLALADQYDDSGKKWLAALSRMTPRLMSALGIISRFSMMVAAIELHDPVLAWVLLAWNVADIFLGLGPQRPKAAHIFSEKNREGARG